MASFTRGDYERVFYFAANVALHFQATGKDLEHQAVEVMDMVEKCIGQMPARPDLDAGPLYQFRDILGGRKPANKPRKGKRP